MSVCAVPVALCLAGVVTFGVAEDEKTPLQASLDRALAEASGTSCPAPLDELSRCAEDDACVAAALDGARALVARARVVRIAERLEVEIRLVDVLGLSQGEPPRAVRSTVDAGEFLRAPRFDDEARAALAAACPPPPVAHAPSGGQPPDVAAAGPAAAEAPVDGPAAQEAGAAEPAPRDEPRSASPGATRGAVEVPAPADAPRVAEARPSSLGAVLAGAGVAGLVVGGAGLIASTFVLETPAAPADQKVAALAGGYGALGLVVVSGATLVWGGAVALLGDEVQPPAAPSSPAAPAAAASVSSE